MLSEELFYKAAIIIVTGFAIFLVNFLILRRDDRKEKMAIEFQHPEAEQKDKAPAEAANTAGE